MALVDFTWYCNAGDQSTTGYYAVAKRAPSTAVAAGVIRRQFTAPTVGNERLFICIIAGTTSAAADATWVLTRGAKTTDGTVTWMEVTGQAALNGDLTNTATWAQVKAATPAVLGQIIKRSSNASYQICTTAGAMSASEPAFSDTAGVTTTDTTAVWTSLGPVGSFTNGGAPFARLASAFGTSWVAAGNTVYVGDNHAESQATAITINAFSTTDAGMNKVICHNHSGSYPPTSSDLMNTATISTTAITTFTYSASNVYTYGLSLIAGAGATGTITLTLNVGQGVGYFENCLFKMAATAGTYITLNGNSGGAMIWNNCQVYFGTAIEYIQLGQTNFTWQNTGQVLAAGSVVPNYLMGNNSSGFINIVTLEALDLSQLTNTIFQPNTAGGSSVTGIWTVKDCKLNPVLGFMITPTLLSSGMTVQSVRSDSGATAYKSARYTVEGYEETETVLTRIGGAVDPTGQAQSRKIAVAATSTSPGTGGTTQWVRPFKAEPYAVWNSRVGANVTVTVCGIINSSSLPLNDEIWMEVEYLGSSATPIGTIVNTTKANILATGAAVASDSSSWNGTALTRFDDGNNTVPAVGFPTILLSNNNLTATRVGSTVSASLGARSVDAKSSGKYYFEVTVGQTHGSVACCGVMDPTVSFSTVISGLSPYCSTIEHNGFARSNNAQTSHGLGTIVDGDLIGFAIDLTARKCWARKNGGGWLGAAIGSQNPANGTGGLTVTAAGTVPTFVPMIGFVGGGGDFGDNQTINFGTTAYHDAAPSGFGNWTATFTPFKLTTTLGSIATGDTYWSNVKLLLGFNGTNGATTGPGMTDESLAAHGLATPYGTTQISTTQAKFGASSLKLPGGSSGAAGYVDSVDWEWANSPFTIECWIYPTTVSGIQFIVGQWGAILGWELWLNNANLTWNVSTTGSDNNSDLVGSTPVVANAWQHVCVEWNGSKQRLYLNGVMVASSTTSRTIFNTTNLLMIGADAVASSYVFNGYIDELRLTKSVARYASDSGFSVPTAAFPRGAGSGSTTAQPAMPGYIHVRVRAAKPSATYYIDPQVVLS